MPTPTTGPAVTGPDHTPRLAAVQGVPFAEIADRYGTPVCVYDLEALRARWAQTQLHLPERVEPAYVLAANPNVSLSATIVGWCARAVVANQTELTSALLAGCAAGSIVLEGPLASAGLAEAALRAEVGTFSVNDLAQARLLDDAATHTDTAAAVIVRVDATRPEAAEQLVTDLLQERFERVRVIGASVATDRLTDALADLIGRLLSQLHDVADAERLVLVRPTVEAAELTGLVRLTALSRVVLATGEPQLRRASTVLTRVVQTGLSGPGSVTLDSALPVDATSRLLGPAGDDLGEVTWSVQHGTEGAERVIAAPAAQTGDLLEHTGIGLLDLPLPVGQILSHGVPAEVLVIDGRAISTRSAATTQHLLSRQRVMSPVG